MEKQKETEVCWKGHRDTSEKSELAKHLIENATHKFTWKVLLTASSYFHRRKIIEVLFIALRKPALNDQLEYHSLSLFHHGIT